jgi:hypothetical protein
VDGRTDLVIKETNGRKRRSIYALTAALALAPSATWAANVKLVASKDNSIFANNVDNSDGGGAGIFVGTTNSMQNNAIRRGLIEFDIASAVPVGATITEVNLTMYLGQASLASGTRTIDLHRFTADWGEGTAGNSTTSISGTGTGFPALPGDATWNQRFYQQTNWTAPGAEGDYVSTISASTDVGTTLDTAYEWLSTPTLVADVQGWLDQPPTNDGWIMIDDVENVQQTVKAFYSRDATEKNNQNSDPLPPEWRPTLEITYTGGTSPTGDYNGNGVVDAADYAVWRKTLNSAASPVGSGADGSENGTIDAGDYTYWRSRFGNSASGFGSSSVPEPATVVLFLVFVPLAFCQRRR